MKISHTPDKTPSGNSKGSSHDSLYYLAFDKSAQPNIISVQSSGKIILANKAACKLLGYSNKELLTKTRTDIFNLKEDSLEKKVKQARENTNCEAAVTAVKKNGLHLPCQITSAIIMENGNVKSITTITDLRGVILKQKNIDSKAAKIVAHNIAVALSKQKIIDILNAKIVAHNILLAISKQKNIDIKNAKIVADNIAVAIRKQIAIEAARKKKVAQDTALAATKSMQEKKGYESSVKKKLSEYKKNLKLIFNSSSDVLYDNDLLTGIVTISDAFEKEYGYKIQSNMTPLADWVSHIHPEDREVTYKDYIQVLQSNDAVWKQGYRFLKKDGSVVNVISSAVIIRDADGKARRVIGSMHDRNKETRLEEKLAQEIKLKEKQIEQAMEEAKEAERSEIGKELHDNVNQLLGASKLYLEMAKHGGVYSEMYLTRSTDYTITAIDEIRKLSQGLTTDTIKDFGLCEAIDIVAADTMAVSPLKISCIYENFIENSVNDKFKLNVFRMVQEQLNNILKHARATIVTITLSQNSKSILLSITDNGVGFDTNKKREGIGVANIKSRAATYKGTAEFNSKPGKGCTLKVKFPVTNELS